MKTNCISCGTEITRHNKLKILKCSECKRLIRIIRRNRRYAEVKQAVLEGYGGVCACCDEDELLFLSIDHVNNDGSVHRMKIKVSGQLNFYLTIIEDNYPSEYQILCRNCNWGKHANGGVCPHKSGLQ